jgi:HSP20 family protein
MSKRANHLSMLYSTVAEPAREISWRPAADVYRTRDGWLLKFELAGVQLDDVRVATSGSGIIVNGVRRDQLAEQDCCHYSMEISYSRFERTVHLPCSLDSAKLDVAYENGILLVRVTV